MKSAGHISFFREGFILSWHQDVGKATKTAIEKFEKALDVAAFIMGEKPWEQVRDEAFAALTKRQRGLITEPPLLTVRRNLAL